MIHAQLARAFHHVEGADQVRIDIGARVFEAVPHPRLRGEVHDHIGLFRQSERVERLEILQHPLKAGEMRVLQQHLVPQLQRDGAIGSGVTLDISGASDQLDETQAALGSNFVIAIVLIYLLLVAIFTHWGYPLFILATVPLGLAGALVGLAAVNGVSSALALVGLGGFHQPFDMITMLGFLILLGTVVNNPILIVDQSRNNLRGGHMAVTEAVVEAVATRLRPILMSTATTVLVWRRWC